MTSRHEKLKRVFYGILLIGLGAVLGIFLSQYAYFKINKEISLSDLFIFSLTSIIAIYIADTIAQGLSRIQSIKALFQEDVKNIINYSIKLEEWIDSGRIPHAEVVTHMKNGNLKLRSLNRIYGNRSDQIKISNLTDIINRYNSLKWDITDIPNLQNGTIHLSPAEISKFRQRLEDIKCELLNAIVES